MVITWSRFAEIKFQPVKLGQIPPYDYMWKLNFVPERRDSFSPGICLDLYPFSLIFLCKHVTLQDWKPIGFHWFKTFLLELFSLQLCLFFFIVKKHTFTNMSFKIGVPNRNFETFIGKHEGWRLFLIKLQTWRSPKRL